MKMIKNILMLAVVVTFAFSCKNDAKAEVKTVEHTNTNEAVAKLDPNATYAKAEFTIEGMTCAIGCAATIEKRIAKMEGVKSSKVDFDKKLAMVEYDEAKVSPESLTKTVTSVADLYSVKDMKKVDAFSSEEGVVK
ncbi:heavy-metal-associated domain-containing protein [Algibacter sp. L4_22]|uniref:heavy-metal-associated domain-containing protein n=2 Tax=unclassified Algibacter TaxID=2615009 RepID=UPI00131E3573|nr:heavy metal-associated domain-containing protein [Algibacter sp. L4_22]